MKKILTTACAAMMALGAVAVTGPTASAAPVMPQVSSEGMNNLIQVDHRRWHRRGFHRSGNYVYLNGHRGYRDYRRGYRRHNDWWFPAGAFIAGAIIGGALSDPYPDYYEPRRRIYVEPRRIYRDSSSAHVNWCYNRYRSYREWDNTFQPYYGPRQQCHSPYSY
jgi:hypothetical protein